MAGSFFDLIVWRKSVDLVTIVYSLTNCLPKSELFGLSSQMRRSAVSIPSNIAEGQQRRSTKDFIKFLSVARGSNAELQTQLIICTKIGYLTNAQISDSMLLSEEIAKMLNSMITNLNSRVSSSC